MNSRQSFAYYNEIDPGAAAWLRELISEGLIAPGLVDERSIEDVQPDDLRSFRQCHFFAGIGGWSYALRLAGWPDDKPVWTGSCPCQPFSAAGKGKGFADERHLWPAWHWLIGQCRPRVVFGEQVAAKAGRTWLDLVSTDLEAEGYRCGPVVLPACGVGAPHIRQRLWFVADSEPPQRGALALRRADDQHEVREGEEGASGAGERGETCGVADSHALPSRQGRSLDGGRHQGGDAQSRAGLGGGGVSEPMGNPIGPRLAGRSQQPDGEELEAAQRAGGNAGGLAQPGSGRLEGGGLPARPGESGQASPYEPWSAAQWVQCLDGKARPIEPGSSPLAHGIPARVVRLRGYGNAIVPQVAAHFVSAYMESAA